MRWALPLIGVLLIVAAMQDLFHTLFHPSESGNISDFLTLRIWSAFRRYLPGSIRMAGPFSFMAVIFYWGSSVVIGFTLIYFPFLRQEFISAAGSGMTVSNSFWQALSLSLTDLITVTLGIEPKSPPLQIAMGIEAVLGFGILSAGISWILSIYPIIEHRRSLSHQITLLHFAEDQGIRRLDEMNDSDLQTLFFNMSSQLTTIRIELSRFPITYYFQEADEKSALSSCLFYLAEIAHDFSQTRPGVRVASTLLGGSVDDLLALVEEHYLKRRYPNRWATLEAFAADHLRDTLRRPKRPIAA